MKILVFGGLGFVGANFVKWLAEHSPQHAIKVADGFTYAADLKRLPTNFSGEVRKCLLQDRNEYEDLVRWADIVVNFAAETHNDNSLTNPQLFYDTNVFGTYELLECCLENETGILHVSTDEVFGDFPLDSDELADEFYPYRPSSPYSASKAASDLMVLAWVRSFGLKAMLTNCTNNFGYGQNSEKFIPNVVSRIRRGEPIKIYGHGRNVRDWLHVEDHCSALGMLVDSPKWGERFNISAYNPISNIDLVEIICEELNARNHPIEFVEDRPGHDLKYALESTKIRDMGWVPRKHLNGKYVYTDSARN